MFMWNFSLRFVMRLCYRKFFLSLRKYISHLCTPGRFYDEDWDQIQLAGAVLTQISISSTDYYGTEFKKETKHFPNQMFNQYSEIKQTILTICCSLKIMKFYGN
jgi:hypothetical protein